MGAGGVPGGVTTDPSMTESDPFLFPDSSSHLFTDEPSSHLLKEEKGTSDGAEGQQKEEEHHPVDNV